MKNKAHGNLLFQTLVSLFPVSNAKKREEIIFWAEGEQRKEEAVEGRRQEVESPFKSRSLTSTSVCLPVWLTLLSCCSDTSQVMHAVSKMYGNIFRDSCFPVDRGRCVRDTEFWVLPWISPTLHRLMFFMMLNRAFCKLFA